MGKGVRFPIFNYNQGNEEKKNLGKNTRDTVGRAGTTAFLKQEWMQRKKHAAHPTQITPQLTAQVKNSKEFGVFLCCKYKYQHARLGLTGELS